MEDEDIYSLVADFMHQFAIVFDYDFSFTKSLIADMENGENLFSAIDPSNPTNNAACLGHLYESHAKLSAILKLNGND